MLLKTFKRFPIYALLFLFVWGLLPFMAQAFDVKELLGLKKGLAYQIAITGVDKDMLKWLKELELDKPPHEEYPKTQADLQVEAEGNASRLKKALQARGYYEASLNTEIKPQEKKDTYQVTYKVVPGIRYHIAAVRLEWQSPIPKNYHPEIFNRLTVKPGNAVDASRIQKAADYFQDRVQKEGCLFSLDVTPVLILLKTPGLVDLVFQVKAGPSATFGEVVPSGNKTVQRAVLDRAVGWKKGDCYRASQMDDTQMTLLQSQLFANVTVKPLGPPKADGRTDIGIEVKERAPRTVKAGVNYLTDRGPGVKLGWEHRNFLGNAEKFESEAFFSGPEQYLNGSLHFPAFHDPKQTLSLTAGIKQEDVDFYTVQTANIGAALERPWIDHVLVGAGANYSLSQIDTAVKSGNIQQNDVFGLLSFPVFIQWDSRNDTLDTQKGVYARGTISPYVNTLDTGLNFLKSQVESQIFLTNEKWYSKPTLALRGAAGSLEGADINDVPADILFHAGGGGSVRGYTYQSLGPRQNGDPLGGTSWVEMNSEIRMHFTETVGAVVFLDAGNVYDTVFPDPTSKLYLGAGAGLRYATPAGPLRFDVGIPLNGSDIEDDPYAIYVSLGQSF